MEHHSLPSLREMCSEHNIQKMGGSTVHCGGSLFTLLITRLTWSHGSLSWPGATHHSPGEGAKLTNSKYSFY